MLAHDPTLYNLTQAGYPAPQHEARRIAIEGGEKGSAGETENPGNDGPSAPQKNRRREVEDKQEARTSMRQDQEKSHPGKSVAFSRVEIREYSVVVGDHPMCMFLPLSLGWEQVHEPTTVDIDSYEQSRAKWRRSGSELVLSYYERKNRLRRIAGLTEAEMFCVKRQFLREKRKEGLFLRPLPPSGLASASDRKRSD